MLRGPRPRPAAYRWIVLLAAGLSLAPLLRLLSPPPSPARAALPALSSPTPGGCPAFRIGLGDDPGRLIDGDDPEAPPVLAALRPDRVVAWFNGYRDPASGAVQGDLSYFHHWAAAGRFAQWAAQGDDLMVITWENYDGQSAYYGPPTRGDYHISSQFVQDIQALAAPLSACPRTVDFVLATAFSTDPACCDNPAWANPLAYSDRSNATAAEYDDALIPRLGEAMAAIRSQMPQAQVGIGFGGWLATFDIHTPDEKAGRRRIRLFHPLIAQSDWIFFRRMIGRLPYENSGWGNPDPIWIHVEFFSDYGKPIGLAHYNPGPPGQERLDVMRDDRLRMRDVAWIREMWQKGLRMFAFMAYGPMKYNEYGVRDLAVDFIGRSRTALSCTYLPLIHR